MKFEHVYTMLRLVINNNVEYFCKLINNDVYTYGDPQYKDDK